LGKQLLKKLCFTPSQKQAKAVRVLLGQALSREHGIWCDIMQVQRDFEELPSEASESLRDSLLNLLIHFSK
jgi:hypothetical protein